MSMRLLGTSLSLKVSAQVGLAVGLSLACSANLAATPSTPSTGDVMSSNRLANAKSPYLLQHADNPVDWYEWSDEAFERAREQDKPIFLSIGYATCHWCHVMEHESFEDERIAGLMNEAFVNIKVDREERPDIDQVYMTVCQALTGGGGWPLTIIMTPDKKPFFAATYIPPTARMGRIGMVELIPKVQEAWTDDRERLMGSSEKISQRIAALSKMDRSADVQANVIEATFRQLAARFDREHGGFGSAPKFPAPHNLLFLLGYAESTGNQQAVAMVSRTLVAMRHGGVFDHVGWGFHRYSTDREWLVPHFEKMLYDQAMLALAYTEAARLTSRDDFAEVVAEIVSYVERDLGSPEGAFFSAEDADSEGEEGVFYLWSERELEQILGEQDARIAAAVWNTDASGNFLNEATREKTGDNILHLTGHVKEKAADLKMDGEALVARLEEIRDKLFEARSRRVRPLLDDKILTDWNGLMAAALARAGAVFERAEYVDRARRTVDFIISTMQDQQGRLLHRYRGGHAEIAGFLDDYAFLTWALLELYETTLELDYLEKALQLQTTTLELFWDDNLGGFFFSGPYNEALLARSKEDYDGAIPAGNSVAAHNLVRLGRLTGQSSLEEKALALVRAAGQSLKQTPSGHTHLVQAVQRLQAPSLEVVVVGDRENPATRALVDTVRTTAPPSSALLLIEPDQSAERISSIAPFADGYALLDGQPAAYVCRNHSCQLPTSDPERLRMQLSASSEQSSQTADSQGSSD